MARNDYSRYYQLPKELKHFVQDVSNNGRIPTLEQKIIYILHYCECNPHVETRLSELIDNKKLSKYIAMSILVSALCDIGDFI